MIKTDKRGFTLIEVIATVAVSSILMVTLVTFFSLVSNIFVETALESESRLVMSSAKAYLRNELTYPVDIKVAADATYDKLEFAGGRLYKNGVQVFNNEFYGNTTIEGTATGLGSLLTFQLTVRNGTTARTETFVLKTLNKTDNAFSTATSVIYYKQ